MDTLYIIILNYNNENDTIECLESIRLANYENTRVVIVDNGSKKECVDAIKNQLLPDEVFIETGENSGYAAGNNVGIKYALDNGARYIAILNNDVIVNKNTFAPCIKILENNSRIGIVGPTILEYNSDLIQSAGAVINYKTMRTPVFKAGEAYKKSEELIPCDYVGGACMVFSSKLIEENGFIPENYFLFWEETEWCCKARKKGIEIACTMECCVNHKGSATIDSIEGISAYFKERNKVIFAKRNAPSRRICWYAIFRLFLRALYKGVTKDKKYFKFLRYYWHGVFGKTKVSF